MRFIHITDTHIAQSAGFSNYGHNPYENARLLVKHINERHYQADFVLHTGDVVEDRTEAAYRLAKSVFDELNLPIYYVAGNHDDATLLQKVMLGKPATDRFDYGFESGSVQFYVMDSRGPNDPAGVLTPEQLTRVQKVCGVDGPPLVLVLHHPPVTMDTGWMDNGWKIPHMLLENRQAFIEAILPAQKRLRGVFFGHVHRAFHVLENGILFASAPSAFAQLESWPGQAEPEITPHEPAGYSIVTVTAGQTLVRQIALPRP